MTEQNKMKKYTFTGEERLFNGVIVKRIMALTELSHALVGAKGGWIQSMDNLSHEGQCWIADEAVCYGKARVSGNAYVNGNATVCDHASVSDRAWITGESEIYGEATVGGTGVIEGAARIFGEASVSGEYKIRHSAAIHGVADVSGRFFAAGDSDVSGYSRIAGNCCLLGGACIENPSDLFMVGPFPSGDCYTFYRGDIGDGHGFAIIVSGGELEAPLSVDEFISSSDDKAAVEAAMIAKKIINPLRNEWEL